VDAPIFGGCRVLWYPSRELVPLVAVDEYKIVLPDFILAGGDVRRLQQANYAWHAPCDTHLTLHAKTPCMHAKRHTLQACNTHCACPNATCAVSRLQGFSMFTPSMEFTPAVASSNAMLLNLMAQATAAQLREPTLAMLLQDTLQRQQLKVGDGDVGIRGNVRKVSAQSRCSVAGMGPVPVPMLQG
jgi:hypothetical protein